MAIEAQKSKQQQMKDKMAQLQQNQKPTQSVANMEMYPYPSQNYMQRYEGKGSTQMAYPQLNQNQMGQYSS